MMSYHKMKEKITEYLYDLENEEASRREGNFYLKNMDDIMKTAMKKRRYKYKYGEKHQEILDFLKRTGIHIQLPEGCSPSKCKKS